MDEKELDEKLENMDLTNIELACHRCWLRMALFKGGYAQKKQGIAILSKLSNCVRWQVEIADELLAPKRLNWKFDHVGTLVIASVVSFSVAIPPLINQTPANDNRLLWES